MVWKTSFIRNAGLRVLLAAAALSLAGPVRAQDPEITDVTFGNRKVLLEWTRVAADTLTPAQRQSVPEIVFNVDLDLGINTSMIRNGDRILGRGAGGRSTGGYLVRIGNSTDFYEVGEGPADPVSPGFSLAGAFQFGTDRVAVAFTDRVNEAQATNPASYAFTPALTIQSATVQENGKTAILRLSGALPATTAYSVTVSGITGAAGEALAGSPTAAFTTVAGTVTDIATIQSNLASYRNQTVNVIGQVYIPVGSRLGTASGYIQDGSGRGINLYGNPVQAAADNRGNVVRVTGTVVDTLGAGVSIKDYTATLVASNQPFLGATPLPLRAALDSRWEGTYIEVRGRLARIDRESNPGVPAFTATLTDTAFAGYRIWRAPSESPDDFILLRSYSLLDSTWTFSQAGPRIFSDPDSIILRGTERDFDPPETIAGPFNGFGYVYSVTYFDAVVDVTIFPTRVTVFERTTPAEASSDPVFPSRTARVNTPLLGEVRVVPNPYNPAAEFGRGAFPGAPRIQFTNLPVEARVSVYTVAGDLVRVLDKPADLGRDSLDWDLKNQEGEDIAPGIYIFYVESGEEKTSGRFVVAR